MGLSAAAEGRDGDSQSLSYRNRAAALRWLLPSDVGALFALYRDPEVRRYFPDGTLTYEQTQQGLDWLLNGRHLNPPGLGHWATLDKQTGEFIGRCGLVLQKIEGCEEMDLSYLLAKAYWGQGLGTEAAQAMARYGFEPLRLPRLICMIDPANQASIKVAQNVGMTLERAGVDEEGPFLLYLMTRSMSNPMDQSTHPTHQPKPEPISALDQTVDWVVAEIRRRVAQRVVQPGTPYLVALDGGSGSGKSTLSIKIADRLGAVMVQSDDFFAAEVTDAGWAARTDEARARDGIDWRRVRTEVLEPLLAGKPARWHAFDFVAGQQPDGTYLMSREVTERAPAAIIVLDGAYSTRPELADLIDLSILVEVPVEERHRRLAAREEADFLEAWHARWDGAERHYFEHVRPPAAFDLVVGN